MAELLSIHPLVLQAGLLLKLAAGRALLANGSPAEAETLLVTLAERVSEGQATFGLIAGLPPQDVAQQAIRYLAQSALARGDAGTARRLYEGLVGREACGRSSTLAESWAHAEYGWMMLQQGDVEASP
jgi:superkiller protein 3